MQQILSNVKHQSQLVYSWLFVPFHSILSRIDLSNETGFTGLSLCVKNKKEKLSYRDYKWLRGEATAEGAGEG